MKKVIRDGKVAVLVSPGHGGGFYSWNDFRPNAKAMLFHPKLVELVEQDRRDEITMTLVAGILGLKGDNVYISMGGVRQLEVEWVPVGTAFKIEEYDGYETLRLSSDLGLITA